MEFLSCSERQASVCILRTVARQSLLSESRCEKGQSPAEMKECEALAEPPLAFTPWKEGGRKERKPTQGHFAESSANKLFLSRKQDGVEPTERERPGGGGGGGSGSSSS